MAFFTNSVSRVTKAAKAVRDMRFTKQFTPLPLKAIERHFTAKQTARNYQYAPRAAHEQHEAGNSLQELRGRYRDRSDRPTAEARQRTRSLSPGRSPRPERRPSARTAQHIATILGFGTEMAVDVEAGEEVYFGAEMDVDVDFDESMDMDIDSDFEADSMFSSSVGSAYSNSTAMSSPPSSTYSLSALGAIELDIEMEDVCEMVEEPLANPTILSSPVPTEHQTYTESTTPPGSPAAVSSSLSLPATIASDPAPVTTTATATATPQPSQNAVQAAPVDYYARAADKDFIEAQSQAAGTALPESDDTDLEEDDEGDAEVPANIPLPGSDEDDIHLADSTPSEIIAEGASDHTLATRPQAAPQGEDTPEDIPLPPTVPGELDEPTTHGDMEMVGQDDDDTTPTRPQVDTHMEVIPEEDDNLTAMSQVVPQGDSTPEASGTPPAADPMELAEPDASPDTDMDGQGDVDEDEDEDDGQEWQTVYDVNVVAAPQAPVSDHVTSETVPGPVTPAPNPRKHKRDAATEFDFDAEDLPATKLLTDREEEAEGDEDDEEDEDYEEDEEEEGPGYDVEHAQAIMNDFLCERLPVAAAQVMFPESNFTARAREEEAQLIAAWLYEQDLPDEGSDFLEQLYEEQVELSGNDLGEIIWNWFEERVLPELESYESSLVEDDGDEFLDLMESALEACFDELTDDDNSEAT